MGGRDFLSTPLDVINEPVPALLDVDTGTDDAVALMFACRHRRLSVTAVTTVAGNVPVAIATQNTLRVLDLMGSDAPVFQGAARPRFHDRDDVMVEARTRSIHGGLLPFPSSPRLAEDEPAATALIESSRRTDRPLVIVACGPLTNLAEAVRLDQSFPSRIERLVVMGGGLAGNATPSAEFNFWCDPTSASVVLSAGFRETIVVPLDVTRNVALTDEDRDSLDDLGTTAGWAAARMVARRIDAVGGPAPVHDLVAAVVAADPSVAASVRTWLSVDVSSGPFRGRTRIGRRGHTGGGIGVVRLVTGVDRDGVLTALTDALRE